MAEVRHEIAINERQHSVVSIPGTHHKNVVNNLRQEATLHYENKVLEVAIDASGQRESANARAVKQKGRRNERTMPASTCTSSCKPKIPTGAKGGIRGRGCATKSNVVEVQRLQAENQQMPLLPILPNEQSLEAGSVGHTSSVHIMSTQQSTPTVNSKARSFFGNVFGNLSRPTIMYAPMMLASTERWRSRQIKVAAPR